jgi:hypothetical protein
MSIVQPTNPKTSAMDKRGIFQPEATEFSHRIFSVVATIETGNKITLNKKINNRKNNSFLRGTTLFPDIIHNPKKITRGITNNMASGIYIAINPRVKIMAKGKYCKYEFSV